MRGWVVTQIALRVSTVVVDRISWHSLRYLTRCGEPSPTKTVPDRGWGTINPGLEVLGGCTGRPIPCRFGVKAGYKPTHIAFNSQCCSWDTPMLHGLVWFHSVVHNLRSWAQCCSQFTHLGFTDVACYVWFHIAVHNSRSHSGAQQSIRGGSRGT